MQCTAVKYWTEDRFRRRMFQCNFRNVTFDQDTKLNIERIGLPEATDESFTEMWFYGSSISLVHPDILAKFPNTDQISLDSRGYPEAELSELTGQDKIENCGNIKKLELEYLKDFSGITSDTFTDCKKLESLRIATNSLIDLPDGLFKNQANLRELNLKDKHLKLRVSPFEGLKNFKLSFRFMDLKEIEENFFQSLNITTLSYGGNQDHFDEYTFPIESLNSQETIEHLDIVMTNLSRLPDNFGPILGSMKQLKEINLKKNLIGSVEAFVDLPNVESINLNQNKIVELPANAFKGCPRLSVLKLSENPIKALRSDEFVQLTGLMKLDFSFTRMTSIGPTTFHPLKSLETLDLNGALKSGQLNNIEKELFINSTKLRSLDLSSNRIQAIHPEAFKSLRDLHHLELSGNKCVNEYFRNPRDKIIEEKLEKCFANFQAHSK